MFEHPLGMPPRPRCARAGFCAAGRRWAPTGDLDSEQRGEAGVNYEVLVAPAEQVSGQRSLSQRRTATAQFERPGDAMATVSPAR